MEQLINTCRGFLDNFGEVIAFVNQPLPYLGNLSIMQLFGASIGLLLTTLLGIHIIRLFVG